VLAMATSRWRLGRAADRHGTLGEGQQEGARAAEGEAEEEEMGGARG
jgi:hypothetical protein